MLNDGAITMPDVKKVNSNQFKTLLPTSHTLVT